MNRRVLELLAAVAAALALGLAHAAWAAPQGDAVERERIANERAAAEAEYAQRERECQTRFVVTSCVEQARRERREALGRLRRQETLLDEAQRKQRAAQRMEAIRAKVSSEEARQPKPTTRERGDAVPRSTGSVSSRARRGDSAREPSAAASEQDRRAQESANKVAFEARQQAAQAHRDAVQRRHAQRADKGRNPASPLPASAAAP